MNELIENNKKVAFYTLGCKLNFSETSSISRIFEKDGYQKVNFEDKASLYVINTCSVTENADKKCKKVVKEALKHSPDALIVIVGCYAQLKPQEIANIPGVDAVFGAAEKFNILEHISLLDKKQKPLILSSPIQEVKDYCASYSISDRTRTFLKVQDGCDYTCSFCTIPQARGESRSDSIENVIKTAQEIALQGTKEIVLTGVNIGDFGLSQGIRNERFIDLIRQLDNIDNINRFRISSIEPNLLSNEVIEFVSNSHKFVSHFHIPLQSGSNKILALMKRRYKRELYQDRVSFIKQKMPNCCIGVDVITGFPGETHHDFLETYQFLNDLDISYLHVFTYSERDNTSALSLSDKVPQKIRDERTTMLRTLSEKKRRYFYEQNLGSEFNVLFEEEVTLGKMYGFTENYIKVVADYDPLAVNEVRKVILKTITSEMNVLIEEVLEKLVH